MTESKRLALLDNKRPNSCLAPQITPRFHHLRCTTDVKQITPSLREVKPAMSGALGTAHTRKSGFQGPPGLGQGSAVSGPGFNGAGFLLTDVLWRNRTSVQ